MKAKYTKLQKERNELRTFKAQDIGTLSRAYRDIDKTMSDRYMGSAVTITIKNINVLNNVIVEEVMIADGLSIETVEAIKKDIKRAYDLRVDFANIK